MGIAEHRNQRLLISTLRVDQVTGEVAKAFHQAGVRPLLLKGPGIARWLYRDGPVRGYGDTDLLVAPADRECAERTLSRLGFAPGQESWGGVSRPWSRGTDHVDLHRSVMGVRADGAVLWRHLSDDKQVMRVGGTAVDVPAPYVRAAHVALHAAQHGEHAPQPLRDLQHALELVELSDWRRALELARRLGGEDAFASGLCQLSAGAELAERLGATQRRAPAVALRAGSAPPVALGVALLAESRGWRARIAVIARGLAPGPAYMRHWSPLASRGRTGLALAYLWRPVWIALNAPAALAAWRRAARADR